MSQHETEQPRFTHVGWQYGSPQHLDESDHLALHLDAPPPEPAGVPLFQNVDDAVLPSPTLFFSHDQSSERESDDALAADHWSPVISFGSPEDAGKPNEPTVFS